MNYGKARELITEARRMRSRPGIVADRVQKIQDKFQADMKTGKATEDMLQRIVKHHGDAIEKYHAERNAARTSAGNKIRNAHHTMRADHYKTHIGNYEKHYANAYKAHQAGDFKKAWAEGSHASSGPHLRDVPYHADYHNAGYEDKK
jgi:TolA-binding protein